MFQIQTSPNKCRKRCFGTMPLMLSLKNFFACDFFFVLVFLRLYIFIFVFVCMCFGLPPSPSHLKGVFTKYFSFFEMLNIFMFCFCLYVLWFASLSFPLKSFYKLFFDVFFKILFFGHLALPTTCLTHACRRSCNTAFFTG